VGQITIDPVTRVEGHLKVHVEVDDSGVVTTARVTGNLFRDFENILVGRHPWDAVRLTQRICGVCPVSHALVSTKAIEQSLRFAPSTQALYIRALIQGANYLQDHILHFYHLAAMDYVRGPQTSPWVPQYDTDLRFSTETTNAIINHYVAALAIRRKGQEMGAIFAGRVPHIASIHPGGVTNTPTSTDITKFRTYLAEITSFIKGTYLPDVEALAAAYSDYFDVGRGPGAYLSYGAFDLPSGTRLFRSGVVTPAGVSTLDVSRIAEDVAHSRYSSASGVNPSVGATVPAIDKADAYTWLKAPRYARTVVEVGPLARLKVAGKYSGGTSVMDRIRARALEAALIADAMPFWLTQVVPGRRALTVLQPAVSGTGYGLTEAPRGALGHWVSYANGLASRYQVVTPTCWNASPQDDRGVHGAMEQALIGTRIADQGQPVELLRIIHSFDPCIGCAVHVITPAGGVHEQFIVGRA